MLTLQHFRNTLNYIQTRQTQAGEREDDVEGEEKDGLKKVDWESVDVVGGCLKMGITR